MYRSGSNVTEVGVGLVGVEVEAGVGVPVNMARASLI